MYTVELLGDWVLNTWKGAVFFITVALLLAFIVWRTSFGSVVLLSSKEFECTMTVPDGLGARCVEYLVKGKKI